MTRAAVLIGVNTTGNAPLLHDAVNGAKLMAKWAEQQQMKVVRLMTDEEQPVLAPTTSSQPSKRLPWTAPTNSSSTSPATE